MAKKIIHLEPEYSIQLGLGQLKRDKNNSHINIIKQYISFNFKFICHILNYPSTTSSEMLCVPASATQETECCQPARQHSDLIIELWWSRKSSATQKNQMIDKYWLILMISVTVQMEHLHDFITLNYGNSTIRRRGSLVQSKDGIATILSLPRLVSQVSQFTENVVLNRWNSPLGRALA